MAIFSKSHFDETFKGILFPRENGIDIQLSYLGREYAFRGGSISHDAPYRKISQSLEGAREVFTVIQLLWNVAGAPTKFQSDTNILTPISRFEISQILR